MTIKQVLLCITAAVAMASVSYDGYSQSARGAKKSKKEAAAEKYDVYLLVGQSNMAGRARLYKADTTEFIPNVWLLNGEDKPEPARSPLNRYSTVRKDKNPNTYGNQKLGPGHSFGQVVAEKSGRKVLLVVNAMGETRIEQWAKTAPVIGLSSSIAKGKLQLYSEAVRRCKEAMKYGDLKGIIWHQGEGDSDSGRCPKYPAQLTKLVACLRADLDAPDVPFIAGETSYLRGNGSDEFNAMIRTIETFVPNSGWVSAEGLTTNGSPDKPKSDLTHFNHAGQIELGRRYAEKALEMCYPAAKAAGKSGFKSK